MAFNPFRAFRKHQKVIMASMVFVAMITFVLCGGVFGKGDFAGWFQNTFMGRAGRNEVARVYGKAVEYSEIEHLRQQRKLANEYMGTATFLVSDKILKKARDAMAKLAEPTRGTVQRSLEIAESVSLQARFGFLQPTPALMQELRLQARLLDFTSQGLKDKPTDKELLEELKIVFQLLAGAAQRSGQLYFGGTSSEKDLLDFMIWRHQADRLGIQLTTRDIQKAIKRETFGRLTDQDSLRIEEVLSRQSRTPLTAESLYTALGDEFRVRMAQEALAGSEFDSSPQVPSLATPREFWDFYRNNLTTIQVALVPVKVEEFTSKIQAKPTEAELQELFKQYRNQEYRPESETPGFKQPRRVQIEWVAGRAESALYQRKAQQLLASLVATTPSVPLPSLGPILALTHRLQSDYEFLTRETFFEKSPYRLPPLTDRNFVLPIYVAASEPEAMASAVAQAAVGTAGNGLLTALTAYQASAVIRPQKNLAGIVTRETQKRAAAGMTLFLASAQPAPALALGGTWHVANEEKQLLPFDALSGLLTRRLVDGLANDLLVGTLEDIEKEVQKLGKAQDKKALQDYLDKLKSNKGLGLEIGKMTEAKDLFAIAEDPALKPFRDAYVRPPASDPQAKQFADMFFRESRLFEPQRWPFNWNTALQPFIYWTFDDKPARALQFTDPGVREKVEAAWRMLKARELAKKEADDIALKVRETKGDVQKLRDLGARLKREPIEPLLPLAHLTRPKEALALRATYRRDELPKELSDKITYPRADMASEILKLQDKKPGDTMIVTDQPEQVFYVTVLIKQTEPSREEFFRASHGLNLTLGLSNLFELFEKERRENYRKELLVQLRHDAGVDLQAFEDRLKTILRGTGGEE